MRMLITGVKDGKSCVLREIADAAPGPDIAITNLLDLPLAELPARPDGHGKLVDTLVPPGLMRWCRVRFVANELRPFHHTDTIDCNTVIDGSIEMLHSEYKNYSSANPAFPGEPPVSLSGKQLTQAPKYSGRLGAEYSWSLGTGDLSLRGDYAYQSRTYFTPFNELAVSQGGHSLTNATLNYTATGGGWHTGLYVNNLSNSKIIAQDYVASELFGGPVIGVLTPPRTYGVRFGVAF